MMASPSSELSLECKPPQSYSMLLKSFTDHNPPEQTTHKLEDYLRRLEEERLKIDAFKRELPLCMQLLTHEMEISRQQLQSYKANQGTIRPVLEEFIPLKQTNSDTSDQKPTNIIIDHKANWMTSAQLWSQTGDGQKQQPPSTLHKTEADINNPKLSLDTKQRNGGAFLPFSKDSLNSNSNDLSIMPVLPKLALGSGESEMMDDHNKCRDQHQNEINGPMIENLTTKVGMNNGVITKIEDTQTTSTTTTSTTTQTTHRKARRCWSPDLHRRFVNALQVLGGSQVATPKQIRELMKVDGLTNDEVKSHLQKYRLHTRRPGPSPQVTTGPAPQLVVLGGIWVPPEYAAAHGGAPTIYSTHPTTQVSPHYCSPTVPQDHHFYPPPPQLTHPQVHQPGATHHHQVHVYRTSSHTQNHSSPESESIEDGKSDESSSWKAESGGENGEKKKIASLKDDGKESNGSEITLKF